VYSSNSDSCGKKYVFSSNSHRGSKKGICIHLIVIVVIQQMRIHLTVIVVVRKICVFV